MNCMVFMSMFIIASHDPDAVPHIHQLRINGVCLPDVSLYVDRSTIFGTNSS